MPAEVGQPAPDFTLPSTEGGEVTLSSFKGKKNVVVFFFPKAFTGTCERQVTGHAADLEQFKALDAEVFGISTDQTPSQQAFAKQCGQVTFPLLSDHRFRRGHGLGRRQVRGRPARTTGPASWSTSRASCATSTSRPKPGEWSGTAGELEALRKIQG